MPSPRTKITLAVFSSIILLAGFGCTNNTSPEAAAAAQPFTLTVWGVWDSPDAIEPLFAAYRNQFPYVTVQYRKLRYEEYEKALLESAADGSGPDVYAVHNTWVKRYRKRLLPAPKTLTLPVTTVSGPSFRRTTSVQLTSTPNITPTQVTEQYVTVVAQDAIVGNQLYGLPLSLDTLVLYYNKDLLDAAGIAQPPRTWLEFKEAVEALTLQDKDGNILQSGAALGASKNIPRSTDILANLMMQNGAEMMNQSRTAATFNLRPAGSTQAFVPGADALRFYTDFASPSKVVYTWNDTMPDAFQAFTAGKLAFFFGYAYQAPLLRTQAPNLRVGVTTFPQIALESKPAYFANYWLYGAAAWTKHPNEAWALIRYLTGADAARQFTTAAKQPTALRALIEQQKQDPALQPFAAQVLAAQSWYQGQNSEVAEAALKEAMAAVLAGTPLQDALNTAADKVNQTLR